MLPNAPIPSHVWPTSIFAPDKPNGDAASPKIDPKVREFLRYILSLQGQHAVVRGKDYLPLTADLVREQLRKLV